MASSTSNGLGAQIVSPFPAPPEYARNYTQKNVDNNAIMCPPPVPNEFIVFGEQYKLDDEIIRPLPAQGIRQLFFTKNDWQNEMKKLNRSAVAAFLDLLDMLIRCPDSPERTEKLTDIHDIFINSHHLINEFRPVQARDTMCLMQKAQVEKLGLIINNFRTRTRELQEALVSENDLRDVNLLPIPPVNPLLEGDEDDILRACPRIRPLSKAPSASASSRPSLRREIISRSERDGSLFRADGERRERGYSTDSTDDTMDI